MFAGVSDTWPGSSGHYITCVTCSCAFSSDQGHTFSPSVRLVSLVSVQNTDICHCLPNATSCQQIHVQITLCSVLHVFLLNAISLLICVGLFKMSPFKYLCNNKYLTFTHICGMHVVIMKHFVYYFIIEIYYTWIYHS